MKPIVKIPGREEVIMEVVGPHGKKVNELKMSDKDLPDTYPYYVLEESVKC